MKKYLLPILLLIMFIPLYVYAEEVCDYLPDGLGLLLNHTVNYDNSWLIPSDAKTIDLKSIDGYKDNLKASDFTGITSLDDVKVITGDQIKLTSNNLI